VGISLSGFEKSRRVGGILYRVERERISAFFFKGKRERERERERDRETKFLKEFLKEILPIETSFRLSLSGIDENSTPIRVCFGCGREEEVKRKSELTL